jgi:hypothetical protein
MDVLELINELRALVHGAKRVPLRDQVRVDKEKLYGLLDQMRSTIPEEIKQARWIVEQREEMLAVVDRHLDEIAGEEYAAAIDFRAFAVRLKDAVRDRRLP